MYCDKQPVQTHDISLLAGRNISKGCVVFYCKVSAAERQLGSGIVTSLVLEWLYCIVFVAKRHFSSGESTAGER